MSLKTEKLNSLKLGPCRELRPSLPKWRVPGMQLLSSSCRSVAGISPGARRGKCRQVQVLGGVAGILRGCNLVRPVKAFARSGVVSFKFIVQVPGLAILQVENAIEAPAILQPVT